MRAILLVFMTQYLMNADGQIDLMSEEEAKGWFHLFVSAVYAMPIIGALIADLFIGKYRTIFYLSLLYCGGHFVLAVDDTRTGLLIGLSLIAVGAGGIKPCVTSLVGDQFNADNRHLLPAVFGWFYFAINIGAFISIILTPVLLRNYGPSIAFAVPGLLMFLATIIIWLGRNKLVHVPPQPKYFIRELISLKGLSNIGRLTLVYLFVAVFWALYDQTASAWVLQAMHLERQLWGMDILPEQIQAANPVMVMLYIPLFTLLIYPLIEKYWILTPLRKIAIGFFLTVIAFAIPTILQFYIDKGQSPSIIWLILAFAIMTAAEVMISITCLEYSYTQAPKVMKSVIMAFFLMSVAIGNVFTSAVNFIISSDSGSLLTEQEYYLFFTGLMLLSSILFLPYLAYLEKNSK